MVYTTGMRALAVFEPPAEIESDSNKELKEMKESQSDHVLEIGIVSVDNASTILKGKKLAIVFVALMMSLLLIALDETILATALPVIASDFDAFSSQGWISSSFILTQTAFLPIWGQLLRIYPSKYALLFSIFIFEIGSLVCAMSQSVNVLIFGRAFSGIGSAGISVGIIQIMLPVTRLEDRPKLFGLFGGVFGISCIIGPLMGGIFTDSPKLTWRFCFYVNLPVGLVTVIAICLLLKAAPALGSKPEDQSLAAILRLTRHMDWTAALLILGMITSLVYSLQTGGNTKPWDYYGVILAFVVSTLCLVALFFRERGKGDDAMVPFSIFKSGSIYALLAFSFVTRFCLYIFYYIPIYYQAVRGQTAIQSGAGLLPLMISTILAVIIGGQIAGHIGRYWHFLFFGPMFLCVGSGLLYTLDENTASASIIGYLALAGLGIGFALENALCAVQAEFNAPSEATLLAQATALTTFHQSLGGVIGLSLAQSVFSSSLTKNLAEYAPTAPMELVLDSPVLISTLSPPALVTAVVKAYSKTLDRVFLLGVPIAIIAVICSLFINNIDMKEEHQHPAADRLSEAETEKDEKDVTEYEVGMAV